MTPLPCRKTAVLFLVALTAALALAASALADKPTIKYTAEGQAAARATVLRRSDLGSGGWQGGSLKPDLSSDLPCPNFNPKQSDLVVLGAAHTMWSHDVTTVDSVSEVLQSPHMVELDWQRSVLSPQLLPCLRTAVAQQVGSGVHFVSLQKLSFPQVATHTAAYRAVMDVPASGSTVRVFFDLVVFGRGRTEVTLAMIAPYANAKSVMQTEIRYARLLASRIRA